MAFDSAVGAANWHGLTSPGRHLTPAPNPSPSLTLTQARDRLLLDGMMPAAGPRRPTPSSWGRTPVYCCVSSHTSVWRSRSLTGASPMLCVAVLAASCGRTPCSSTCVRPGVPIPLHPHPLTLSPSHPLTLSPPHPLTPSPSHPLTSHPLTLSSSSSHPLPESGIPIGRDQAAVYDERSRLQVLPLPLDTVHHSLMIISNSYAVTMNRELLWVCIAPIP